MTYVHQPSALALEGNAIGCRLRNVGHTTMAGGNDDQLFQVVSSYVQTHFNYCDLRQTTADVDILQRAILDASWRFTLVPFKRRLTTHHSSTCPLKNATQSPPGLAINRKRRSQRLYPCIYIALPGYCREDFAPQGSQSQRIR